MGKGWVEEKIPLIVQNAFAPKETEVTAREMQRCGKKRGTKLDLGGFFLGMYRNFQQTEEIWSDLSN